MSWQDQAACRDLPKEVFFPEGAGRGSHWQGLRIQEEAKAVCAGCQVRDDCLTYGLREVYGIWGGMTYNERQLEARRRRRAG